MAREAEKKMKLEEYESHMAKIRGDRMSLR
jgi:hypothetical protein